MNVTGRIQEAEECIRKAEKSLKTSLISLKFKPDYDGAASEYERAAVCYKNAKLNDKCLAIYLKAADCHMQNGSNFHCAKAKEQGAFVARDLGKMDQAKQLMEEAAQLYAESGTAETSAMALDKAGKFFEATDPDKAIDIYQKGYDLVSESDKQRQASEFLSRMIRLQVRIERFDDAMKSMREEVRLYEDMHDPNHVARSIAGLVVLQLKKGDPVAAMKELQFGFRQRGFETTEPASCLQHMIQSFEDGDEDKFQLALGQPAMKSLDNDMLRLMRNMHVPDELRKKFESQMAKKKDGDGDKAEGGDESSNWQDEMEEEYGGGLR